MPELPEVETVKESLKKIILNKKRRLRLFLLYLAHHFFQGVGCADDKLPVANYNECVAIRKGVGNGFDSLIQFGMCKSSGNVDNSISFNISVGK